MTVLLSCIVRIAVEHHDLTERVVWCVVQGMSEELLLAINREATRRMTALVAPQASEQHGPEMLRLSMGPLFEQARTWVSPPLDSRTESSWGKHLSKIG